jgi:hypothetical protein
MQLVVPDSPVVQSEWILDHDLTPRVLETLNRWDAVGETLVANRTVWFWLAD